MKKENELPAEAGLMSFQLLSRARLAAALSCTDTYAVHRTYEMAAFFVANWTTGRHI